MNSCFEAVEEIKKLDSKDPDWDNRAACIIKRAIHEEKFHVYYRIFLELKYGPKKLRSFKKHARGWLLKSAVQAKIETHDCFRKKPYSQQIYGMFDWRKNK